MQVKYVNSTRFEDIALEFGAKAAHFTNGTYMAPAKLIVPTTLAGFKRVLSTYPKLPLVIAINSDISLRALGKSDFEAQEIRAQKVAEPLAVAFPDNQVRVIYYDEITPTDLYRFLHTQNLTRSLHKWGYGTAQNEPKIEGAESFEFVYAFPLPNDLKPVCYYVTEIAEQQENVKVVDLRGELISPHGVLFELPDTLKEYCDIPQVSPCLSPRSA